MEYGVGVEEGYQEGVARGSQMRRTRVMHATRRVRSAVVGLGAAAAFVATQGVAQAQESMRLTVRPKTMATGTTNPAAGEYPLQSVPDILVTVPQQCVGAHRCPLFVVLPGAGYGSRQMTDWIGPVAKKYGFILFASSEPAAYDVGQMDAALKEILKRFAIDPDKIGIMGRCASGASGTRFGIENLDVFSRVASVSGGTPVSGVDPNNKTAQFLIDRGFLEGPGYDAVRELRKGGHPVTQVLALRGHEHQAEDYDFVGHWLTETWAHPGAPVPAVVANPVPLLSSDMMTKMTTFWTLFAKEPDSIRVTARRASLHEVAVPVGTETSSVWLTNMPALAAKYPSVAADLKQAGLTAQEHDAARVALLSAMVMKVAADEVGTVDASSPLAQNVAFVNAHLDEFKKLRAAGIAHPDQVQEVQATATIVRPDLADAIGPMGIWRTP